MQANESKLYNLAAEHRRLVRAYHKLRSENQISIGKAEELLRSNVQLNQTIAALTRMQSELLIAAKNAALGVIVAGVSHELSTPVGNGLMAASTILHQADQFFIKSKQGITRGDLSDFIQTIHSGAEILVRNLARTATIVANFKELTGDRLDLKICTFNLHDVVETIIAATLVYNNKHLVINDISSTISMNSYVSAVSDVCAELIKNSLRHGLSQCEAGTILISGRVTDSKQVEISIEDNGRGISPEYIERIFDPFFTTTLGQGRSGLGLHVVYNLIRNCLLGEVRVCSDQKWGTRFTIIIPADLDSV